MEIGIDRSIRHWWVFVLRGVLFILAGVYMMAAPGSSYIALGFFFGLIILLAGISELLHVVRDRTPGGRGWHLILGVIDIVLGVILMGHISASVAILRIIVGIWFLFRGISLFSFSRIAGRSWMLTLGAVLTVLFALLILFNPAFGAMTIILWTAIAFVITGIFNVMLGYRLKSVFP